MKTLLLFLVALLAIRIAYGQTPALEKPAKPGETVLVVIVPVKADKKVEYEAWIRDIMYAGLYKSKNPMKKDQLKVTRYLTPVRQNDDKTWTFAFLMDPAIPKTNYDIPTFLNQEYGEEKGKQYWSQYESFLAGPVVVHALKQTDY